MADSAINTTPPTGPGSSGTSVPAQVVDTTGNGSTDIRMPASPPPVSPAQAVLGRTQNPPSPNVQTSPQPPPPTINPALAHAAKTGMGWHALMGTHGEMGPNGTVTQAPNKPGDLFRSILAGAIMGASAGAQAKMGGGVGSLAVGAGAAQQQQEQQKEKLQAQSQQQFQNQQKIREEQRAEQSAATEDTLRKAQIAQANMETLRINQAVQGQNFDLHQKVAEAGKAQIQPYVDAGLPSVAKDIPESEKAQYWKDHPGSSGLDWEATGTKLGVGPDGQPTYELTYSAYDPKGKVNVSQSTYDQWKKDGVFDRFPEYGSILKDNKELTATQFVQIKKDADKVRADALGRQTQDLTVKKLQTEIDKDNAEKANYLATAGKIRQETKAAALGTTQAAQFNNALEELNKKGGNFDALTPGSRVIIAESMNKMVPALNQQYRDILSDPTNPNAQADAGEVLKQIQSLTSLGTRALSGIGTAPPPGTPNYVDAAGHQYAIPAADVAGFLASHKDAKPIQAAAATDPLQTLSNSLALIQDAQGNTTSMAKETVQTFLASHPEYKLVGYGKTPPASPAPTPAAPAPQPGGYQGR